jgi:cell wall-associated NlpC family hydrolase
MTTWSPPALVLGAVTLVTACAGTPAPPPRENAGPAATATEMARSEVVLAALGHIDAPYRYGGVDGGGLDCSALVQRAYREAGLDHVPRTTADQARAARIIPPARIQPGDVLFFAIQGNRIDHVGVFIGDGRFVHAPSSRGQVRVEPLASSYWQPRLRKAGHFFE